MHGTRRSEDKSALDTHGRREQGRALQETSGVVLMQSYRKVIKIEGGRK